MGSYTLSSGDGTKTLYIWYKNAAGNVSSGASDSIIVDTIAPTVTITSPTTNPYTTISNSITISGTASDSGSGAEKVTWYKQGASSMSAASGTSSWSAISSLVNGDNTIYIGATDKAGNAAATKSITVTYTAADTTAPGGAITINTAALYTNSATVNAALSSSDSVGVTGYYLSTSATKPLAVASG